MILEQYLFSWKKSPTTLYTLLQLECMPEKQTSNDAQKVLAQELEMLNLTMGNSKALALSGDNIERKRSAIEGKPPQSTMDIYLFQHTTEDPLTLIECKYRKILPTKDSKVESKVVTLYKDVKKKWEKSKTFLTEEGRQINEKFFVVTNALLSPMLKFHITSYNLGEEHPIPIQVVDTMELHERLKDLNINGL